MTAADPTPALRAQLIRLLTSDEAHQSFESAVDELPADLRRIRPDKLPYSIWQLVDHIRIAQWDILEFSRDATHQSPPWPDGYWSSSVAPPDEAAWQQALDQIRQDRDAFIALLNDPQRDLFAPFPHGEGQTLLREALLIVDHTAYHVGQIVLLRRMLNDWAG